MKRGPFEIEVPIRFGEADPAGILYFPRLFHFCHVAMEEFVAVALGIPYVELLQERNLGFPTVRTEGHYHRPMPWGRKLRILLSVPRMGQSSLDFRFRLHRGAEESPCAEVLTTVVAVAMDTFVSRPLPDDIREAFLAFAEEQG